MVFEDAIVPGLPTPVSFEEKFRAGLLSAPAARDPRRFAIEISLMQQSAVSAIVPMLPYDWRWLVRQVWHAWLSLPKCPCCGDDDHYEIFPLVPLVSFADLDPLVEIFGFHREHVCPKCRNWARNVAMKAVAR